MAIVCCNLLLGYTLLKTDATDAIARVFTLSGDSATMHTQWDNAYAEISQNLDKAYKIILGNDWQPTKYLDLDLGGNIVFDLNGHTIDGGNLEDTTAFLYQSGTATQPVSLEITNSLTTRTGEITNFKASIVTLASSSLVFRNFAKLSAGIIKNNYGACIMNGYARLEIAGGIITKNNLSDSVFASHIGTVISGGQILNNIATKYIVSSAFEITGGRIANNLFGIRGINGTLKMTAGEIYHNLSTSDYASDQVYISSAMRDVEITGGTIIAPVGADPIVLNGGTANITGNAQIFSGEVSDLSIIDNGTDYQVGDTADLTVIAEFRGTYNGQAKSANITLSPNEYQVSYAHGGDSLQGGNNTVVVTYGEKMVTRQIYVAEETPDEPEPVDPTPDEPAQPDIGDGEDDNDQPENPDDGEDVETPDDNDDQTPTTPDNQPTPEAPKAETPNNTPWIMLFVGIGVGAVLLVGGITLGVVLSKRKSK